MRRADEALPREDRAPTDTAFLDEIDRAARPKRDFETRLLERVADGFDAASRWSSAVCGGSLALVLSTQIGSDALRSPDWHGALVRWAVVAWATALLAAGGLGVAALYARAKYARFAYRVSTAADSERVWLRANQITSRDERAALRGASDPPLRVPEVFQLRRHARKATKTALQLTLTTVALTIVGVVLAIVGLQVHPF